MTRALVLCVLAALGGCAESAEDRAAADRAAGLKTALTPPAPSPDTLEGRKRQDFQKCSYVYETEPQLRECLVMKSGWDLVEAELQIARYKAELRRISDSITARETERYIAFARHQDSLRTIERRRRTEAEAAERQRQEAAAAAARQAHARRLAAIEERSKQDVSRATDYPVWGSRPAKAYFANSDGCALTKFVPEWDRVLFVSAAEARAAGYIAYDANPECRP